MNKKHIIAGIRAYRQQQREILDAIRSHGGRLTAQEFDDTFGDYRMEQLPNGVTVRIENEPRLFLFGGDRRTFVLSPMQGTWGQYLQLMQLMMAAGLVKANKVDGQIVYSLPVKAKPKRKGAKQ